jgi:predicted nucleic acid-binding protein
MEKSDEAICRYFSLVSDKDFSFTDCTSFVLMKKLRIEKAFAFDDHFVQTGFELF